MTPEQKSKQASANSNASRLKWQRQAIANGELARKHQESAEACEKYIATLQAKNECLANEIATYCRNIDRINAACRQAENEADIWRSKAHDLEDMDVQRKARDMAKGG